MIPEKRGLPNKTSPELASKFAKVIESLTDEARVRELVDEIYVDQPHVTYSPEDRARIAQAVTEDFGELNTKVKAGAAGGKSTQESWHFLDDPPTAVFVTACEKAKLRPHALDDVLCTACDDGRLWINGSGLGALAQKYVPGLPGTPR